MLSIKRLAPGPLRRSSRFRWRNPAPATPTTTLEITSTVQQLDRDSRVRTEETWTGAQVEADVPTATALLGAGLEQWLGELKATAETHSGGPRT